MLHAEPCASVRNPPPTISDLQFLSVEITPNDDGSLWISSTGTYVDEDKLEFFNDDIEHVRVTSLDDALSTIRKIIGDSLVVGEQREGY